MRCRSWKCVECAPGRRKRLIAQGVGGKPTTFITFTLRADDPRPRDEQVRALSRAWRIIRARICRKWKVKRIPFLAVVERTKRGTPHLHVLSRVRFIDQAWLSAAAGEILDAPIVDIRKIDQHRGIASYVAKYVGKNPEQFGTCKRYWQSPDYDLRDDDGWKPTGPIFRWEDQVKCPLKKLVKQYEALGYSARWTSIDRVVMVLPKQGLASLARSSSGPPSY